LKTGGKVALGGAVAVLAPTTSPRQAKAAKERKWTNHWGMLVDLRRCIGCQGCTVACKAENGVPLGVFRRRVRSLMRGTYPDAERHFLPISCFHCEDPACLEGCAKHTCFKGQEETAIHQTKDGYVVIDKEKCGADKKPCMSACPYHNVFYDPVAGKADKCTFCDHRVKQGIEPACVQTCQGDALMFGDLKDPSSEIARVIAANETKVLKPKKGTHPSFHYIGLDPELQRGFEAKLKGKRLKPTDLENDR
jgi:tetrathionate reductase subunit B